MCVVFQSYNSFVSPEKLTPNGSLKFFKWFAILNFSIDFEQLVVKFKNVQLVFLLFWTKYVLKEHAFISITFIIADRVVQKPQIDGPENTTAVVGDNVTLKCQIRRSDLAPHIQWVKHYSVNGSFENEKGIPYVNVIKVSLVPKYQIMWILEPIGNKSYWLVSKINCFELLLEF